MLMIFYVVVIEPFFNKTQCCRSGTQVQVCPLVMWVYSMADRNVDDSLNIFMCQHYLTRKQLTQRDMEL